MMRKQSTRYSKCWIGVGVMLGGVLCAVSNGMGEDTYSLPVATGLDLQQVGIEFESAPELRKAFQGQTVATFARAEVPLPPAVFSAEAKDFTLKFTQKQISLEPQCPGKVFYLARREFIEPVYLQRNKKLITLSHWDTPKTYEVGNPRSHAELLESLDSQLEQFLVFYVAGNPGVHISKEMDAPLVSSSDSSERPKENLDKKKEGEPSNKEVIKTVFLWEEWNSLDRLNVSQIYWPQQDAILFPQYKLVAERLSHSGITLRDTWPEKKSRSAVPSKLTFSFESTALGEACPGYVVYTVGVALKEPVLIKRNSLEHMADTWGTFRVQVRPPMSAKEMKQDLLRLVDRLVLELKATQMTLRSHAEANKYSGRGFIQ